MGKVHRHFYFIAGASSRCHFENFAMKRSRKSVDVDAVRKKVVKISEPQTVATICPSVALSSRDKAAQLMLSDDQLICYGCEVRPAGESCQTKITPSL